MITSSDKPGTGVSTPLLEALAQTGGDAIGLDWRTPLDAGWSAVGEAKAVQGNLDPATLLGPWERVESAALDVLEFDAEDERVEA